jgi:23S rRNA (cytidine1920-2'-O)/16S rRNA (cytidine1409-2'-O)-methyltransferase
VAPTRLDLALVERGLAESRNRAQGLILAGDVTVDGVVVTKAGAPVRPDQSLAVREPPPFVSRAGIKLANALDQVGWSVEGESALDLGASTGGFTDCLLKRGALRVIALDVGRGQLHQSLRTDPRVHSMERTNARALADVVLPFSPTLLVADLSFISLTLVLGPAFAVLAVPWRALVMVKPQFEAGRDEVGPGGVVSDPAVRARAVAGVARYATSCGAVVLDGADSLLPGPSGNREYFLALASPTSPESRVRPASIDDAERIAHRAVDSTRGLD